MRSCIHVLLLLIGFSVSIKADELSVQMYYPQGKAFFEAGKDEEAIKLLSLIPLSDKEYGLRSQYILAAIFSRQGNFDKAHDCFMQIIKVNVKTILDRTIRDLAILGNARLYYHQGQTRQAVLAYRLLGLDSVYASIMLYELGMTYLRYGDSMYREPSHAKRIYESAAKTLEDLYRLDKKMLQDPRLRLMIVDVSLRLGKNPKANLLYQNLIHVLRQSQQKLQEISNRTDEFATMLLVKRDDPETMKTFSWICSQPQVKRTFTQLKAILKAQEETRMLQSRYQVFLETVLQSPGGNRGAIKRVRQQIENLDRLQLQAKDLEEKLYVSFRQTVKDALPVWSEQMTWLLAGADSGLLRGVLREQYQYDEQIRQIEMTKAKELSKINSEFDMSHGDSL